MKYLSILLITIFTSCSLYEANKPVQLNKADKAENVNYKLFLSNYIPDTILRQLRDYKVENHLLRVEIDDLKRKLERLRKLQKIDSILNKANETK